MQKKQDEKEATRSIANPARTSRRQNFPQRGSASDHTFRSRGWRPKQSEPPTKPTLSQRNQRPRKQRRSPRFVPGLPHTRLELTHSESSKDSPSALSSSTLPPSPPRSPGQDWRNRSSSRLSRPRTRSARARGGERNGADVVRQSETIGWGYTGKLELPVTVDGKEYVLPTNDSLNLTVRTLSRSLLPSLLV